MTFQDVHSWSYRLASFLQSKGVGKGSCVLLCLRNSCWFPVSFLASALTGAVVSAISHLSTKDEIKYYAKECGASIIMCEENNEDVIKEVLPEIQLICIGSSTSIATDLPLSDIVEPVSIDLDDILAAPFSSGTGGSPKCVLLTHRNYHAATAAMKEAVFDKVLSSSVPRTLSFLPLYHASGFWALLFCLLEGCKTVIMDQFHPDIMVDLVQKHQIDTINVVPSILSLLARLPPRPLCKLRTVLCGSSPLSKQLSEEFLAKYPSVEHLIQGYGMTEVVVLSHVTPIDGSAPLGSCGRLLPGFQAKIVDESGYEVPMGSPGELMLSGEAVMKGYKERTRDDGSSENPFVDGWLKTGDVVFVDEHGFFFVVDRLKDLIKVNGLQVSPVELEALITTHPLVAECAVVGKKDNRSGQVPWAIIVLKESTTEHDEEHIQNEIMTLIKETLAAYKHLKGVEIRNSLPRNKSGKTLRRSLQDSL